MLDALRRRFEERKVRAESLVAQETARITKHQRILEQAQVMAALLEDPRYHEYRQLLEEARASLVEQMIHLRHEGDSEEFQHDIAVLQGRLFQLDSILNTPDTFLALAEQGDTANGTSRQSVPTLAASARKT